jgi:hypothetical protein
MNVKLFEKLSYGRMTSKVERTPVTMAGKRTSQKMQLKLCKTDKINNY